MCSQTSYMNMYCDKDAVIWEDWLIVIHYHNKMQSFSHSACLHATLIRDMFALYIKEHPSLRRTPQVHLSIISTKNAQANLDK